MRSMKKIWLIGVLTVLAMTRGAAQEEDRMIFNHLGVGISVGTTALGLNVSTTLTPHFGLRAGINIWPMLKMGHYMHFSEEMTERQGESYKQYLSELNSKLEEGEQVLPTIDDVMDVEMRVLPKLTAGHLLVDYYPFPHKSSFHLTAGAHIGTGTVVNVHNKRDGILMPITKWNNAIMDPEMQPTVEQYGLKRLGLALGDYFIMPDEDGNIDAKIIVNGFRPYLGLGFGRAVPRKRIGCQFDLGVQFWGSPKVYVNDEELKPNRVGDELDDILSIVSRVTVFPVVNFRLVGRIF